MTSAVVTPMESFQFLLSPKIQSTREFYHQSRVFQFCLKAERSVLFQKPYSHLYFYATVPPVTPFRISLCFIPVDTLLINLYTLLRNWFMLLWTSVSRVLTFIHVLAKIVDSYPAFPRGHRWPQSLAVSLSFQWSSSHDAAAVPEVGFSHNFWPPRRSIIFSFTLALWELQTWKKNKFIFVGT